MDTDTIVACATPTGRGGIGVVRVSGSLVRKITPLILNKAVISRPRYATFSDFVDQNKHVVDQGIAIFFPAPHSFTGEDVLELYGHGGPITIDNIIKMIVVLGARLARPGEFSERAFLNGKIDLTQAEAIADLIDATSTQAACYALRSLQGEFSRRIHELVDQITKLRVVIEASIDFAEEDLEVISTENIHQQLANILQSLSVTQSAAQQGVVLQEGVSVVIAGKPNVGKSSLLNCLSGEERAIVTPIAGTTRDVLRAQVRFDGMVLELLDTAGLRGSSTEVEAVADAIEREGIRRALAEIEKAQYVLLVVDCVQDLDKTPQQLWKEHFAELTSFTQAQLQPQLQSQFQSSQRLQPQTQLSIYFPRHLIVVYNKIDLAYQSQLHPKKVTIDEIDCVFISAKNRQGIDLLRQVIKENVVINQTTEGSFSARRRHLIALSKTKEHLLNAQNLLIVKPVLTHLPLPLELIAEELREAQQGLGEITGEVTSEDLLSLIFSEFCVGK